MAGKAVQLKVSAIKCPLCNYIVFSRARHDFRSCKCGAVSVDGGFDYMKCSWDQNKVSPPVPFEFGVDATKRQLYEDYNRNGAKYGLVAPDEPATPAARVRRTIAARTNRPRPRRTPTFDRQSTASRRQNAGNRVRKDTDRWPRR